MKKENKKGKNKNATKKNKKIRRKKRNKENEDGPAHGSDRCDRVGTTIFFHNVLSCVWVVLLLKMKKNVQKINKTNKL